MRKLSNFIFVIIFSGCSPIRAIKDSEIKDFNIELKNTFEEIVVIKTYVLRPSIHWELYLNDSTGMEDIFQFIVSYIKNSNIYEERLKDEYTGIYNVSRMTITFYKYVKELRTYEGHYYHRVVRADDAVNQNKIDNFNTWYITEKNKKMSIYEYKNNE